MDFSSLKHYFVNYDYNSNTLDVDYPVSQDVKESIERIREGEKVFTSWIVKDFHHETKIRNVTFSKNDEDAGNHCSFLAELYSENSIITYFPKDLAKLPKPGNMMFDYFDYLGGFDKICGGFFEELQKILYKRFYPEFHPWAFFSILAAIACIVLIPQTIVTEIMMAIAAFTFLACYCENINSKRGRNLLYTFCAGLALVTLFYFVGSDEIMDRYRIVRILGFASYSLALFFVLARYLYECCIQSKLNTPVEKEFCDYFKERSWRMERYIYYHVIWWRTEHGNKEFPKRICHLEHKFDQMHAHYLKFKK